MTRYADPLRCPDCHAALTPGAAACTRCALPLLGETAQRLYNALALADELLTMLRASATPAAAALAPAPTGPFTSTPYPAAAEPPRRSRLTARSVPAILLALGAGCLLVAALVFLAVTWSVLGVGGRTATLVGLTVVAGALGTWMARRGLRAAAESLALVGYGLLTLDVLGADRAGWWGDLSAAGLERLVGAVLVLAGFGAAVLARRTAVVSLTGAQVVAGIGTALVALGVGTDARLSAAPALVLATVLAGGLAAVGHRLRLRVAVLGSGLVTVVTWLSLAGYALDRAFGVDTWRVLWLHLEVWPLLVSAGLAAIPALLRRLPIEARVSALAATHLLLSCALLAPTARWQPTAITLVAMGVLVAATATARLLPRPWGLVNGLTQATAAAGVLGVAVALGVESAVRMASAAHPVWSGAADDRLAVSWQWASAVDRPAAWLLPVCVLVLAGTGWAAAGLSPAVGRTVAPLVDLRLGAAALAASVAGAVALYPVPVWLVLAVLVVTAAGATAWWLGSGSRGVLAVATGLMAVALLLSLHAAWLSALVACGTAAFAATVQLRARDHAVAGVGGATLAAALGGAVWSWGDGSGNAPVWTALVGILVLGALVLLAPYAPERWWASDVPARARTWQEVGAGVSAALLLGAGVLHASARQAPGWTAVYLTVCGVVVTVMSLVRPDRRVLAPVGGVLLAAASWVRLWDLGVSAPEPYTLPSALVLLLFGLDRLRRDRSAGTVTTLAPAVSLALVPSLLWALDEPTGLRPVLLGIGCLLLVMAGARLGWTAPLVLGAGVGAVLVLRLAAPYVGDAVPRWVLIGAAGALLIAVGATWERRLAEARSVVSYVQALR
jgi:hypothetical protein